LWNDCKISKFCVARGGGKVPGAGLCSVPLHANIQRGHDARDELRFVARDPERFAEQQPELGDDDLEIDHLETTHVLLALEAACQEIRLHLELCSQFLQEWQFKGVGALLLLLLG